MSKQTISSTEFQHHPGQVIDRVRNSRDTIVITAHGRPQMVIVSMQEYEGLLEAKRAWEWMQTEAGTPRTDD